MANSLLILPTQLYEEILNMKEFNNIYLYEHPYYFNHFKFHKQKLILHRATMKNFQDKLVEHNFNVTYINFNQRFYKKMKCNNIMLYGTADHYIHDKFINNLKNNGIKFELIKNHKFLNDKNYNKNFFKNHQYYHRTFYIEQRKRLDILIDNGKPIGGKWSYDPKNRKKFPPDISIKKRKINKIKYIKEAKIYIEKNFQANPGKTENFIWPINHQQAVDLLNDFLENYLDNFGPYQDAFDKAIDYGFHSLISSSLNIGILTPEEVLKKTLLYFEQENTNIESVEGFIRQIIGWREYVRALYDINEKNMKNSNYFNLNNEMPKAIYNGDTEVIPFDNAIYRVINNAYTHHIERLMVLGNFMLLLMLNPEEVYSWFMEMFIDAYDWVMIPNIYGMSQYSYIEMMTKPYISSSNYILKMSNYTKEKWSDIWDALYWDFINFNKEKLAESQRMNLILNILNKMDKRKLNLYEEKAKHYKDYIYNKY